jgi:hypothetical protein
MNVSSAIPLKCPLRLFGILFLVTSGAILGCGGGRTHPPATSPPTPTERGILLRLGFQNTSLSGSVASAELRIADTGGSIVAGPLVSGVQADSAHFDRILLADGTYDFVVRTFNGDLYQNGYGETRWDVGTERDLVIHVSIAEIPPDTAETSIGVTWPTETDSCVTIVPSEGDGAVFVYYDADSLSLNRFSPSGWMGDLAAIQIDTRSTAAPASGQTCVRLTYSAQGAHGWSGIYWLPVPTVSPNWKNVVFGYDLRGMAPVKLKWKARGSVGGENVQFFLGGGTPIGARCPDSMPKRTSTPTTVTLSTAWQSFEIDVSDVPAEQLEHLVGGFGWVATAVDNPAGCTFYLDEVEFTQ